MNWLTDIGISHYLILAALLFTLGLIGVLIRKNGLIVFMCIELMLNAVNLTFIAFANQVGNEMGHAIVFFIMTVAAAEAAVGLAIFVALFRGKESVYVDEADSLRY